jgi:adenine deaminase
VKLPARLRIDVAARRRLIDVASGVEPADLALTGGRVLNVFTGRVASASIGLAGGRIAWVGDAPAAARREVSLDGGTVVPGLIDPHCHTDIMGTPTAFVEVAARKGTTTAVVDTHILSAFLDDAALERVMTVLDEGPMKVLWGVRPSRDGGGPHDDAVLPPERLRRLLAHPGVASTGEMTAGHALLAGDERLERYVSDVVDAGLRVDGHAPGASPATLARLAAAGLTSDHEAISGDELAARVEVGLWTMVRHSSLRQDGVELGRAVAERGLPLDRLLLTADGVLPQDLVHGHLDTTVRKVIEGGVRPADAVRMGTLNPATYLGLDAHVGAIAPGRCADLLIVDDLATFRPEQVMCDGCFLGPGAAPDPRIDWETMRIDLREGPVTAEAIVRVCEAAPPIDMRGVVARLEDPAVATEGPRTLVALVARDGRAIAGTTTRDFPVRAVASTVTAQMDVLLMGSDPQAMAEAYRQVVSTGGGLASPAGAVALPTFGHLRPGPIPTVARELAGFEAAAGLPPAWPPFSYRTLFLTLPALPGICLTADGLLDVKARRLLTEAAPL